MNWNEQIINEFHENKGVVGGQYEGVTLLLLHVIGAKTGKEYIKPLAYTMDGDHYVIVASKGGAPTHPNWYYNLIKNPDAKIELGTETYKVKAHESKGTERERLYEQHANQYPGFWEYKKKTDREIPVFYLERID